MHFLVEDELPLDFPPLERGFQLYVGYEVFFAAQAASSPGEFVLRDVIEGCRYTTDVMGSCHSSVRRRYTRRNLNGYLTVILISLWRFVIKASHKNGPNFARLSHFEAP